MNKTIVIIIAITLLSSCHSHHPTDLTKEKETVASSVATIPIEKNAIKSTIKLPGELKPFEKVDIYPKMNGFVKEMYVDRGSSVHKGEILMTLEAPEIAQQIQAAQAKLLESRESINASRDRYFRLRAASRVAGSISELDLMNAASKYQSDSALVQSEQANLNAANVLQDYLVVRAPFDGMITERNIHPGALTGPSFKMDNKPLLVLESVRKLRLEVFIPEAYAGSVNMDDKQITFTTQSLPGQSFTAMLTRYSHSLYDQFRSEAVEADVLNDKETFQPGMYVEASLKIKSDVTSYVVPSSAILTTTEGKYVISVINGKAKFINVREGISSAGKTEIFGDIHGDEVIVKEPSGDMREGIVIK